MHNGSIWWNDFVKRSGYNRIVQPLLNIPRYDPRLERLLNSLGMSFREALMNHTHLPYVMAFQEVEHQGLGDVPSNGPTTREGGGQQRAYLRGKEDPARYCPECLALAFDVGEPHWHLSHQLPNVHFCGVHRTLLLSACPKCGTALTSAYHHLIDPMPSRCACGHDLSHRLHPSPQEPDLYERIRLLSMEAAQQVPGRWSIKQLRTRVEQLYRRTAAPNFVDFLNREDEGYRTELEEAVVRLNDDRSGTAIVVRNMWCVARASDVCAVMAMLRCTFDEEKAVLPTVGTVFRRKPEKGLDRETMKARLEHQAQRRRAGKQNDLSKCSAYWYFRLEEPAYLEAYPELKLALIPSIADDRAALIEKLDGRERTPKAFFKRLSASPGLYMRLHLRDREWLVELRGGFVAKASTSDNEARKRHRDRIRGAIAVLIREEVQPRKLTLVDIAAQAQLSISKVRVAIAGDHELGAFIEASNAQYLARACDMAIASLRGKGDRITLAAVMRQGGFYSKQLDLIRGLVRRYVELHKLEPHEHSLRKPPSPLEQGSSA